MIEEFRARHGVPGIGMALLEGAEATITVAGSRVRGGGEPVTAEDRWHIGSCAKAMTAATYARMVERGEAAWETSVAQVFPDITTDPVWARVTIADLLTHVSGLPRDLTRAEMIAAYSNVDSPDDQRTALARKYLGSPPKHQGKFVYSNLGYTLAGAAIERLSRLSYEDTLRREILDPLGVTSAGFGAPQGDQPWGHRARFIVYGKGPAVDPTVMTMPYPADNPPVMGPAGRLHLSLADWARFIRVFMDGGELLGPGSIRRLTTPPEGSGSRQGMGWAVPAQGETRYSLAQQGCNLRWGATALAGPKRAVLIVCNDGRLRLLSAAAKLAVKALS